MILLNKTRTTSPSGISNEAADAVVITVVGVCTFNKIWKIEEMFFSVITCFFFFYVNSDQRRDEPLKGRPRMYFIEYRPPNQPNAMAYRKCQNLFPNAVALYMPW